VTNTLTNTNTDTTTITGTASASATASATAEQYLRSDHSQRHSYDLGILDSIGNGIPARRHVDRYGKFYFSQNRDADMDAGIVFDFLRPPRP